ncbi:MAG: EAL domain-containing protein [Acidimicrobiales bacterium]|nr:EAL domain-containing protein [Acidimicrobiales bacterium]
MNNTLPDAWTDLVAMIQPGGLTTVTGPLAAFSDAVGAEVAWLVVDNEVTAEAGRIGIADSELLISIAHSDANDVVLANEVHRVVRGKLTTGNGTVVFARADGDFTPEQIRAIGACGHLFGLALASHERRGEQKSSVLDTVYASSDALTGLLTRDGLRSSVREDEPHGAAVIVLGVDGLRVVNDTLGHAAGDLVLQSVAARIQTSIRDADVAARVGGDIFAIYCPGLGPDLAAEIAGRVQTAISQPIPISESDLRVTVSVGVAASHSEGFDKLAGHADTAMRAAKQAGRQKLAFFDEDLRTTTELRRSMAHDLQDAIANNHLATVLEAIYSLPDLSVMGREASIRWQHPTRGLLDAEEFVGLAQDIGRIADLERAVVMFALNEYLNDSEAPPTSINLSAKSVVAGEQIPWIIEELQESSQSPERLIVEIPEDALLIAPTEARRQLDLLRENGVGVVLDNFGSSNGSLRSLHAFPFDGVKLHPSLIDGAAGRTASSLVQAVYAAGESLGFEVIHTGLDTPELLDRVTGINAALGRGSFYGQGDTLSVRFASA